MNDLRTAAQQALEALEGGADSWQLIGPAIDALKEALVEPVQEPVAWRFEARHIDSAWAAAVTMKHPGPEGKYMRKVTPLYAAPPQRKPLTEGEISNIWDGHVVPVFGKNGINPIVFARAIERAHGIGDNT